MITIFIIMMIMMMSDAPRASLLLLTCGVCWVLAGDRVRDEE